MSQKPSLFVKYVAEIVLLFLFVHAFLPFLSPILFSYNSESSVAIGIQKIYSNFCHQRIDRSLFLFGGDQSQPFYTIDEFKELDYLTEDSEGKFGYPYWGNEDVGYKVAYCIRDVALYSSLVLFAFLLLIYMNITKKIIRVHWLVIVILLLPMAIDGVFQTVNSFFNFPWVPEIYMESFLKRIITGILFGFGIAILIFTNLKDASGLGYND